MVSCGESPLCTPLTQCAVKVRLGCLVGIEIEAVVIDQCNGSFKNQKHFFALDSFRFGGSIRHSDDREDWKLRIARQRMYQTVPQGCGVLCFVLVLVLCMGGWVMETSW
jgi:hypothetical protein